VLAAVIGILALSAALAGFLFYRVEGWLRFVLFVAAACALFPDQFGLLGNHLQLFDLIGALLLLGAGLWNWKYSSSVALTKVG
jgi:TRAP-type uncharacterized transport system fused permease subunit